MGRNGENKGTGRARWSNKSGDRYQIPSFSPHFSPRLYTATFFSRRLLSFNRSNPPPPRVGCLSVNFCVKRTLKVDRRAPRAFPRRHKQQRSQFQREQSAEVQTTSVGYHFGNVNSASGLSCSQVIIVLMFSIILSAAFIVTINSYMGLIIEKFDEWSVNNKVMNYELFVRKQYVFIFFFFPIQNRRWYIIHNDRQIKFWNVSLFVTKSKICNEWMIQKLHKFFLTKVSWSRWKLDVMNEVVICRYRVTKRFHEFLFPVKLAENTNRRWLRALEQNLFFFRGNHFRIRL